MTPSRGDAENLFEQDKVRVWLSIGKVELPLRLASQRGVAGLTHLLDEHLGKNPPTPPKDFTRLAEKALKACYSASKLKEQGLTVEQAWEKDEPTLAALYRTIYDLHKDGRNGMWARIIKNAFAPVFLAPFDFVAGNPPWINWQNLPEGYRNETKHLWQQHGLFVHRGMEKMLGKAKLDISMLVTFVAADSYLKDGGKLGFVITQSVFKTSGAGQGFRRFKSRRGTPLGVVWVDDFSEMQLFEGATNRTAVFILQKGKPTQYPVNYGYWRKRESGRQGGFDYDSTLEEVTAKCQTRRFIAVPMDDRDPTSAWLSGPPLALKAVKKLLGKSDYEAHEGINTGGANAVYWFEILKDHGDGTVTARNITEGAKRKIESVQVRLEKELLYPLLRGRDVQRWRAQPSAHILFVQDVAARRGMPVEKLKREFPLAWAWLERNRKLLEERAAFKRYFRADRDAFYSMFNTGDYTMAEWKVVWKALDLGSVCCVVGKRDSGLGQEKPVLPEHNSIFISCDSEEEAHFVCGCFNSTIIGFLIASVVSMFYSANVLDYVPIPKFDPSLKLHQRIAAEAQRLAGGAADAAEPVHERLDELCAELWGVDKRGLRAIQSAYRDLYVTAPRQDAVEKELPAEDNSDT